MATPHESPDTPARPQAANGRWSKSCPSRPGKYLFRCDEAEQKPEERIIVEGELVRGCGRLWVTCPDTGRHPVYTYHHALGNPSWKRIS